MAGNGILSTFVPSEGQQAGTTYYLPPQYGDIDLPWTLDTTSLVQLDQQGGKIDMRGGKMFFPEEVQISVNLDVTNTWVADKANVFHPGKNYYGSDPNDAISALRTALLDFIQCCAMGGDGVLTCLLPPNTKNPASGAALTNWTAYAKVGGAGNTHYKQGGDNAQVTAIFIIKTGLVKYSDGTWGLPIY